MTRRLFPIALTMLAACKRASSPAVEDLTRSQATFELESVAGTRDGDQLRVRAIYTSTAGRIEANLYFLLTPQPKLQTGSWTGPSNAIGTITERSTTFLGGQSGPPSFGGKFDLITTSGAAAYRITIPLQPLTKPL